MHLEDAYAVRQRGIAHINLTIEAPCTQQCFVEHIGAVGGCKHDDAAIVVEAVHLGKQLIERVFALVVVRKFIFQTPCLANGIYFVDKDDAGRFFFRFFKEVAHA